YNFCVFEKVGGGSAGSVLANRLSEDNSTTVLLLEAGDAENVVTEIPLGWSIMRKSKYDWDFEIEPQDVSCFAFQQRKITLPRGKALGGSSILGNLLYTRGNRRDFDSWFDNGSIGWSWDDLFPYFLLSEDNKNPEIAYNGYHGRGGYL
ncbi:glucose dehydrogenase-like [FAD: quinone], partial [Leptotrombidium deliense]